MQVREIMTANPACCTPDSSLREIAQMMVEHDCGCIPVVENQQSKKPVGTITDRDITIRAFATGQNPADMKASDVMSTGITTITPETSIQECCDVMEDKKIRRVIVVDKLGRCSGIVAQADIAEYGPNPNLISEVVHEISESEPSPNKGRYNRTNSSQFYSTTRFNPTNQSFPVNRSFSKNRAYSTKNSLFSISSLLPLLAGIGIAAGAKYFFDSGRQPEQRAIVKRRPDDLPKISQNLIDDSRGDLSKRIEIYSSETRNPVSTDTNFSNQETKTNTDTEIGRTASQR